VVHFCLRKHVYMVCVVAFLSLGAAHVSAIEIARDGVGLVTIVTVDGTTPAEKHAARELADFLKQVTGTEIPITKIGETKSPRILIGEQSAKRADPDFSVKGLGRDGLIIRTVGDDLILAGGRPRGTLYAAYTFLEDYVGCRWWTPDANYMPHKPTLKFDSLDIRYVPPLEYREPYWHIALNADWAVRNKVNGQFMPLDKKHGGKYKIAGFVHTFYGLLPSGKYFKDHPEWYSEIDGKRVGKGAQLCLSNEEMRKEFVKNFKKRLRAHPNARQASVSQNDGRGACQCAKCRAIVEEEGSESGPILRFVNAVAADVEEEFPNIEISTLAYHYSQKPPKHVKPHDNVVIWLCTFHCSFNLPVTIGKRNQEFVEDMNGWARIAKRLYIWDYTTNFKHYMFIHPNLRVLGPNIRFFLKHNAVGVFEQGAYQSPGAEMAPLRAWLLAKLLWNPSLDDEALIKEFLDGYYGSAGKHIYAYLDLIHDVMQKRKQPLGIYEEPDRYFMKIKTLAEGWSHLQKAAEAVADDPELLHRVKVAQLPIRYGFLMRWEDLRKQASDEGIDWPMNDDPQVVFAEFKALSNKIGVTHIGELEKFDKLDEKLKLP